MVPFSRLLPKLIINLAASRSLSARAEWSARGGASETSLPFARRQVVVASAASLGRPRADEVQDNNHNGSGSAIVVVAAA